MPTVLINYQERKKAISIEDTDLLTLAARFFDVFEVESEGATVTFQRYDNDWEEEIDLAPGDEIVDKDRLTAVVIRTTQVTPSTINRGAMTSESEVSCIALALKKYFRGLICKQGTLYVTAATFE